MLKFTKYGKGPGGKASFSSSQKQKSESDVAMQAFKVATQVQVSICLKKRMQAKTF